MTPSIPRISIEQVVGGYDAVLFDAYGVLITHDGALPGAAALIEHMNAAAKPFFILTNDASRSVQSSAERYREMGLDIPGERILTSGLLLESYFKKKGLTGSTCIVLGTEDSAGYVRAAGGRIVSPDADTDAETVVVCDERGYPLRETLDHVVSFLYRRLDRGDSVHLILANPDLVYPAGPKRYGLTAGSVAHTLSQVLEHRYPERGDLRFVPLGKPHRPMFEEAERRAGSRNLVMIGDQIRTDIRGANDFGIDSVLVPTGLARLEHLGDNTADLPAYILETLEMNE